MSIARTWSGATRAGDADEYLEYLRRTGLKDYADTPGNEGIVCLRRLEGSRVEFTILTLWKDHRAIEAFAGLDTARAVFYPEDDAFLVRKDEMAGHHEVVFSNLPIARKRLLERFVRWWSDRAAAAIPAPRTREGRGVAVSSLD
jgi:heme-degrading monooxygenase HmoA